MATLYAVPTGSQVNIPLPQSQANQAARSACINQLAIRYPNVYRELFEAGASTDPWASYLRTALSTPGNDCEQILALLDQRQSLIAGGATQTLQQQQQQQQQQPANQWITALTPTTSAAILAAPQLPSTDASAFVRSPYSFGQQRQQHQPLLAITPVANLVEQLPPPGAALAIQQQLRQQEQLANATVNAWPSVLAQDDVIAQQVCTGDWSNATAGQIADIVERAAALGMANVEQHTLGQICAFIAESLLVLQQQAALAQEEALLAQQDANTAAAIAQTASRIAANASLSPTPSLAPVRTARQTTGAPLRPVAPSLFSRVPLAGGPSAGTSGMPGQGPYALSSMRALEQEERRDERASVAATRVAQDAFAVAEDARTQEYLDLLQEAERARQDILATRAERALLASSSAGQANRLPVNPTSPYSF